jgi:ABC-type transport system involved in multi-copper enzyme maturation permease subunit
MNGIAFTWFMRILDPAWLAGPIFDKELRVSSRRRRNYALRFLYVACFTLLLSLVWANVSVHSSTSVYQASRMAMAGLMIITFMMWFQFLAAQFLAAVMLSTSISDEIFHRTLGVLMTTPIGSAQIVLGKLFSKLLQLVLLLGIMLPLLAVVRVLGGVPWSYLICSWCVTLATVVFVGSLSLFFSIFTRRAYLVIVATVLTLGFLFAFLPLTTAALLYPASQGRVFYQVIQYVNPYVILSVTTRGLLMARAAPVTAWPVCCGILLGASALLLFWAMMVVRKVALRQATGQTGLWSRGTRAAASDQPVGAGSVRRVIGPPVLWKERRMPLLGKRRLAMSMGLFLALGLLGLTYWLCARHHTLGREETHVIYLIVFMSLGMLSTLVVPATCITAERESRTWPLLLATTLGEWDLLGSKLAGALYRCLPAWAPLFGHCLVFVLAGLIHPLALLQFGILVAWILLFLVCTGLYFSTSLRHTTAAVIANIGLAAGLWALVPLLLALSLSAARAGDDLIEVYVDLNPFVHAGVIAAATAHRGSLGRYPWVQGGISGWADATGWMILTFTIYMAVGFVFLLCARARLRRNPF